MDTEHGRSVEKLGRPVDARPPDSAGNSQDGESKRRREADRQATSDLLLWFGFQKVHPGSTLQRLRYADKRMERVRQARNRRNHPELY